MRRTHKTRFHSLAVALQCEILATTNKNTDNGSWCQQISSKGFDIKTNFK